MLEPRESDVPALFLLLVVLPLVAYILLGKWSETAKKRSRITLLAQLAAEEALKTEDMAVINVIPPVSPSKNGFHVCARCSAPARTRCSRCKSVRYCSGNCQIIHWRQIHKKECQQLEFSHRSPLFYENMNSQFFGHNLKQCVKENAPLDDWFPPPIGSGASTTVDCALFNNSQDSTLERKTPHKSNGDTWIRDNGNASSSSPSSVVSKEKFMRPKSRNNDYAVLKEDTSKKANTSSFGINIYGQAASRSTIVENDTYQSQHGNAFMRKNNYGHTTLSTAANNGKTVNEFETDIVTKDGNVVKGVNHVSNEVAKFKCFSEITVKGSLNSKKMLHPAKAKCSKSSKSTSKALADLCCPELEQEGQITDQSNVAGIGDTISSQGSNVAAGIGFMKMVGSKKSPKLSALANSEGSANMFKETKMLFPYEEFVKLFQSEAFGIHPRGLSNCGNSCYANAVLQCLTCTKPLAVFLLCRSHSKACCAEDWCLMCELEQHIMMLREEGGPLSPSRILWHMRSINCQMADGSQEDAHEFLRLLIASMQSICLEGFGGEKKVDPRLQETTFVQHTFGGCLQSKVKCLNCNHESERYENIMDLTLEILGWVDSLEDALTQFTSPEDLDGENMYRCLRCTAYVRARKQLSIHEAPNILTIVLKRFQEGRYGKINKCITFPEMLNMIPFMTEAGDIPPLYMLYAVVVHMDTLNASFSGHYISYVKDLQGNWFRIDDTEVQPVATSQVMSEEAYILFYMRSCPRPQVAMTAKAAQKRVPHFTKDYPIEAQKPSKSGNSRYGSYFVAPESSPFVRPERIANSILRRSTDRNVSPVAETYAENIRRRISDATLIDLSMFTSSDEASFTTNSTRDSFSTVDYADSCNVDPISSILSYAPGNSKNSVCY